MIKRLLFAFICMHLSLFASDRELPMSDLDLSDITNVGGVNVITGNYSLSIDPFVISGSQPLTYNLFFSPGLGWKDNFDADLYLAKDTNLKLIPQFCKYFDIGSGGHLVRQGKGTSYRADFVQTKLNHGATNYGTDFSAKSNLHGIQLEIQSTTPQSNVYLWLGDGTRKDFTSVQDASDFTWFHLERGVLPSGNVVHYQKNCMSLNNSKGLLFGSFCHTKSENRKTIESSDGRKMIIDEAYVRDHYVPQWIYLPNAPSYLIEYTSGTETTDRCIKRVFRAGRTTELSYYPQDARSVAIRGRVRALRTPSVGKTGMADRYKFEYFPEFDKKGNLKRGRTIVEDANGCRTLYRYSPDMRIQSITKPQRLEEQFGWTHGNLTYRSLSKSGKILLKHEYHYERPMKGNLQKETTWGTFTGFTDQLERVEKKYTYSNDRFNNLTSFDDGNKVIRYFYKSGTDLCSAELTTHDGQILKRKFFFYDDNATLIKEIEDDGNSEDPEDYDNVNTRKITRYTPKSEAPCLGLPLEVKHLYWDPVSREEILLSREMNEYSTEGWVVKKEIYNADDDYCYTLYWEYNQFGQVTKEVNALGHVTLKKYDDVGDMIQEINPKGSITTYDYDYAQRPIQKEFSGDDIHTVEKTTYNVMGQVTEKTDIYGCKTTFQVDRFGREVRQTLPAACDRAPVIEKAYDAFGNLALVRDPEGNETKTTYNCLRKPLEIIHPDNTRELFRYHLSGVPVVHIAKNGTRTEIAYDCLLRPIRKTITSSGGEFLAEEIMTYDAFNLIAKTDAEGRVTTYEYDGAGRKIAECLGERKKTFHYDKLGRLEAEKVWRDEGLCTATINKFDYCGHRIETRVEDEAENLLTHTFFEYNELGQLIGQTQFIDGQESKTEWTYNALSEVTQMIDPQGNITQIDYNHNFTNERGQRVLQKTTTSPNHVRTIETFDIYQNLASVEIYDQKPISKTKHRYDINGHCVETIYTVISDKKSKKIITAFEYDSCGRLTKLIEAQGSADERVTRTEYNSLGKIESVTKPNGTILHYEYDPLGQLKRHYSTNHPHAIDYHYTYDRLGNILTVFDPVQNMTTNRDYNHYGELSCETLGNGHTVSYRYDLSGRMTQMIVDGDRSVDYIYDACHLREIHTNGYVHEYTRYDQSGRTTEAIMIGGAGTFTISYDAMGRENLRLTSYFEESQSYDSMGNLVDKTKRDPLGVSTFNYSYDGLNQLTNDDGTHYQYDSLHNRLKKGDRSYQVNDLNQIQPIDQKITYDANGNRISDEKGHYTYDALDRLIRFEDHVYTYDAFHRRLKSDETAYIYANQNEIGSESPTRSEFRALGKGLGAEIGAAVLIEIDGQSYAPIHDHTGSLVVLIDADSGKPVETVRYTAFGEELSSEQTISPWRFSSKRADPSGLIYFGRRFYDPILGRWINCDPRGFDDGPNLYAYVKNNPLTHFDEYGLKTKNYDYKLKDTSGRQLPSLGEFTYGPEARLIKFWDSYEKGRDVKSHCFDLSSQKEFKKLSKGRILFINGVDTPLERAFANACHLGRVAGNRNVHVAYNSTSGSLAGDVLEWKLNKSLHIATPPVGAIHEELNDFFSKADSKTPILVIAHSHGSTLFTNALMCYPKELRSRIHAVLIAPSCYVNESLCGKVVHYRASFSRDFVPLVSDPFGAWLNRKNVMVLPSHPGADLHDHGIQSPTYEVSLENEMRKYIENVEG